MVFRQNVRANARGAHDGVNASDFEQQGVAHKMSRTLTCVVLAVACAGCAQNSPVRSGELAYQTIPATAPSEPIGPYLIEPLDLVSVRVFNEPELSVENGLVDTSGRLPVPLLGSVSAAGKSPDALAGELQHELATYLINPRVSVSVNQIIRQVTVEGQVNQPGMYDVRGNISLIQALALARSPKDVADLDQIFVYRPANGEILGARFDLKRIRLGIDPDPVILPGDRIVVGVDEFEDVWRTYLADPIDSVFRVLANCSVGNDGC